LLKGMAFEALTFGLVLARCAAGTLDPDVVAALMLAGGIEP
jgi:hypothetical protein